MSRPKSGELDGEVAREILQNSFLVKPRDPKRTFVLSLYIAYRVEQQSFAQRSVLSALAFGVASAGHPCLPNWCYPSWRYLQR